MLAIHAYKVSKQDRGGHEHSSWGNAGCPQRASQSNSHHSVPHPGPGLAVADPHAKGTKTRPLRGPPPYTHARRKTDI